MESYGKLIIIKDLGADKVGHCRKVLCRCECGNEKIISKSALRIGNTTSCGCERKKRGASHASWKGHGEISSTYFSDVKHGAERRGIPFAITIDEAWQKFTAQKGTCALSGKEISLAGTKTASLDRIDSERGYTPDNIQWVHFIINKMKNNATDKDFIEWCGIVADFQRGGVAD